MKALRAIPILVTTAAVSLLVVFLVTGNSDQLSYRTSNVTRGDIAEIVTASGVINPVQMVMVGTQVSGKVNKVYVHVNDRVKADQLLAEIDQSVLVTQLKQDEASLETARMTYEQAERNLDRTRMLMAKDFVAKVDLETAELANTSAKNAYDGAKIVVERDKVNLDYARITSPIDGVVTSQEVTQGETVTASYQTPNMFQIAGDLSQMKIDLSLSEADVRKVQAGMPVTFNVDAYPSREFSGKVQMVNLSPKTPSGLPGSGGASYTAIVEVENKDMSLLQGMTAYVNIMLSKKSNVLRVPAAALRFTPPAKPVTGLRRLAMMIKLGNTSGVPRGSPSGQTIYLMRDGAPTPVAVATGASDDLNVEVSGDDLKEGDSVVTGMLPTKRP
jgi:HlyD family secretion protein